MVTVEILMTDSTIFSKDFENHAEARKNVELVNGFIVVHGETGGRIVFPQHRVFGILQFDEKDKRDDNLCQ